MQRLQEKRDLNREKQKSNLSKEITLVNAFKTVFNGATEESKIVYNYLRWFCFYDASTLTAHAGTYDPIDMAVREGQRKVFLEIQTRIHRDTTELEKKLNELQ